MQQPLLTGKKRIESIDILRGIVMVIMALDHVRDYFHIAANTDNPLNLATTTPLLFFTRWITHFCAPIFVFLSGTSVYLQSLRKTKKELSIFLIKRGLWLVFAELIIVSFAWSFNPHYDFVFLQVIWAIGISMFLLGLVIQLPFNLILVLGLVIVLGHNLLDIPESAPGFKAGLWWDLLHHANFVVYPYMQHHAVFLVYAFLPWTGLMMLGYCTGIFFTGKYTAGQRRKNLLMIGAVLILFFIITRFINVYGDPVPWSTQKNNLFTLLSFINVNKYPPSLLYMSLIIGSAFLFLAFIEKVQNSFTSIMVIYGRVPFFYYILHIYLVHLLAVIAFFARGHSVADITNTGTRFPFYFVVPGEGVSLTVVYIIWLAVVVALFPLCRWYNNYKTVHKEKWWLAYL
ncbi:MAG: heparan-alpha-glucosaminide N-acetyltransferase domain-containing protein [Bacteroidota bacterium]